jgi:hypothetical protein
MLGWLCIMNNAYNIQLRSTIHTYNLPPDDGLLIRPKRTEVWKFNKLKINSTSCCFLYTQFSLFITYKLIPKKKKDTVLIYVTTEIDWCLCKIRTELEKDNDKNTRIEHDRLRIHRYCDEKTCRDNNITQAAVVLNVSLHTFPNLMYYLHKFPLDVKV